MYLNWIITELHVELGYAVRNQLPFNQFRFACWAKLDEIKLWTIPIGDQIIIQNNFYGSIDKRIYCWRHIV